MFNYKQLLTFSTIVEEGSFSKAAKKLYVTQPAISSQIKAMEKELDLLLIERGERGILLTQAGELLYKNSKIILNQYEVLMDTMDQFKSVSHGNLRLAASTIPGEYLLPRYIHLFKKETPNVKVFVEIGDSKCVLEKVINGEVAIGILGFSPKESQIEAHTFISEKLQLICSPEMPYDQTTSFEQLLKAPHILREEGSGTRAVILKHIKSMGYSIQPSEHMVLGSTKSTLTAVEQGLGITWISEHAIEDALKLEKVKTINEAYDIERAFYIVTQKKRTLSPLDSAFIEFLTQFY